MICEVPPGSIQISRDWATFHIDTAETAQEISHFQPTWIIMSEKQNDENFHRQTYILHTRFATNRKKLKIKPEINKDHGYRR